MNLRSHLLAGQAIPALPLALDSQGVYSEKHERALVRYYFESGVGGLAVGVHSTQFEIRDPQHALFEPVLKLAIETMNECLKKNPRNFIKIAGVCGQTSQAIQEAELVKSLGYQAALLSMAAWAKADETVILDHCKRIAEILPIIGFYLQPSVGGRAFSYKFWRQFSEIPNVIAIKMAPFNRYQTIDVVRAVIQSGREDIALYTGNDDNIVADLLTPYTFDVEGKQVTRRIVGGLLGHWGVWTKKSVELLEEIKALPLDQPINRSWLMRGIAVTDMNAALFDAANGYAGCIPGILEVLRRQGLVPSIRCLNPHEALSPGQAAELTRVSQAYPELVDDDFISKNLDKWLE